MTENEKIELFDKWYDENYDEWAEGEEGIALREELEQAFKSGIATLEKENAELKAKWLQATDEGTSWAHRKSLERENRKLKDQLTNAKKIIKEFMKYEINEYDGSLEIHFEGLKKQAEQFLKEVENDSSCKTKRNR